MSGKIAGLFCFCAAILLAPYPVSAITMNWSYVGDPGNSADTTGYGAVNYAYYIGTYDVTQGQYVAFLNANDPTGANPLDLFNSVMNNGSESGDISFNWSAASGSKYSVSASQANLPIIGVTWYDTIRFANWMDNGQPIFNTEPTATNNATENGSYTLDGFTPTPSNGATITRNSGAVIVLPNENEWYKAAYYDPATSSYFQYPTSSNIAPNASEPTSTPNSANYNEAVGSITPVGAYSGTTSPSGAYDMAGDVWQWNERSYLNGLFRSMRGGSFEDPSETGQSSGATSDSPPNADFNVGFRLAMVPEPSSIVLAIVGCVGALALRKRLR